MTTHTLHYWSDDGTAAGTWSVYREQYASVDTDVPIDGTQEHVSQHASEVEAEAEAHRLQALIEKGA